MAKNGNNNGKSEFEKDIASDFDAREEVLVRDIAQHKLAIEVAEEELARIRAAKKALS